MHAPDTASTRSTPVAAGCEGISTPASAGHLDSKCASPVIAMTERRNVGLRRRLPRAGVPPGVRTSTPSRPIDRSVAAIERSAAIEPASIRQSGFRNRNASPRAPAAPWLQAGPKPRFSAFSIRRNRASPPCADAASAGNPSADALSTTMTSIGTFEASTRSTQRTSSGPLSAATITTLVSPSRTPSIGRGSLRACRADARPARARAATPPATPRRRRQAARLRRAACARNRHCRDRRASRPDAADASRSARVHSPR